MKIFLKTKGFTLIELLVVVSIISLLSSVILASVRDAREKAQVRAFVENLKQVQTALELYRTDYGIYPPPVSGDSSSLKDIINQSLKNYIVDFPDIGNNFPSSLDLRYIRYPNANAALNYYRCNSSEVSNTYIIIMAKNLFSNTLPLTTLFYSVNGNPLNYYCVTFQ